jgi:hypothetical protein
MNDQPSPFDPAPHPLAQNRDQPHGETPAAPKRRRAGRPAKAAQPSSPATSPKRRGPKPRAAAPRTKVPVPALKVDFSTALAVASELKPEDTELFGQIAVALQKLNRKSRARIATALGRMFG